MRKLSFTVGYVTLCRCCRGTERCSRKQWR